MLEGWPPTGPLKGLRVLSDCVCDSGRPHCVHESVRDGLVVGRTSLAPVLGLAIADALPQVRHELVEGGDKRAKPCSRSEAIERRRPLA
ncbi:MAG TPA: hypothetical protein VGH53_32725 [Streptosporangiaceae bacterium]